jgi:hypothetical protein
MVLHYMASLLREFIEYILLEYTIYILCLGKKEDFLCHYSQ